MDYPENVKEMINDFQFLTDWEDRYMHVIDMGKLLPSLNETEKTDTNKVKGCVSQVWLISNISDGPDPMLNFRGDSDAHIVKGLVAIKIYITISILLSVNHNLTGYRISFSFKNIQTIVFRSLYNRLSSNTAHKFRKIRSSIRVPNN